MLRMFTSQQNGDAVRDEAMYYPPPSAPPLVLRDAPLAHFLIPVGICVTKCQFLTVAGLVMRRGRAGLSFSLSLTIPAIIEARDL